MAEAATRPVSTSAPTTDKYVSTLDIHKPHIKDQLVQRYSQRNLMGFFEQMGQMEELDQTDFHHYEEDHIFEYIKTTGSASSSGAGTPVTVTIASGDHAGSGKYSYPQTGELVMFANNKLGYIYSKSTVTDSAHTITIYPLNDTDDLGTVAASSTIIIYSTAFAEDTGQPEGRTPKAIKLSFTSQIFKREYKVTGTEATNIVWFDVPGQNGEVSQLWYLKGESDTRARFDLDLALSMVVGDNITNTTLVAAGLRATQGVIPFIKNKGGIVHHTGGVNFWGLAQLDSVIDKMDKNLASKENTVWGGLKFRQACDNFINAAMQGGAIQYAQFNGKKEIAINFGFDSIGRSGYSFHLNTLDVFNHPKLMGAPGFAWGGNALIIPTDPVWTMKSRNGDKKMSKPFLIRYKAKNKYKRDFEHWLTGGAIIADKTDGSDSMLSHYRAERALEAAAPNKFVWIED